MPSDRELIERLRGLLEKATKGPFDVGPCDLVRAVRDDLAVPMFEPRAIFHDPAMPAPTVRHADGTVQFRAGSDGASTSQMFRLEAANSALVVAALNALPELLDTIASLNARVKELEKGLERISAQGSRSVSDAGAAMEMLRIARTLLSESPSNV